MATEEESEDYTKVIHEFDQEVFDKIVDNDPTIINVTMDWSSEGRSMNWEVRRDAIASNTHLKFLRIYGYGIEEDTWGWAAYESPSGEYSLANLGELLKAVSYNTSIEHLELDQWYLDGKNDTSPFSKLQLGKNIKGLSLSSLRMGNQDFALLLKQCKESSLENLALYNIDNYFVRIFIELGHRNLTKISLTCEYDAEPPERIGWDEIHKLGELLVQYPMSKLKEIDISSEYFDNTCALYLGKILAKHKQLKALDISSTNQINVSGWLSLSQCFPNLEKLHLAHNNIDDELAVALFGALENNTLLKTLNLSNSEIWQWQGFQRVLQTSNIEELYLSDNVFTDESLLALANNGLANNTTLKILGLQHIARPMAPISTQTWAAFATLLLQSPNCALQELDLGDNEINDETAASFANTLTRNNRLGTLNLPNNIITQQGWMAFSPILCNKSSITNIMNSNHTLNELNVGDDVGAFGISFPIPDHIKSLINLNRNTNKVEVTRQKILRYYFLDGGDIRTNEFVDMELNVLPHALSWIGRDMTGISLLYRVVQNIPSLFDSDAKAKMMQEKKRKRQGS